MSVHLNHLAIQLTKAIEHNVMRLCSDVTRADEKTIKSSPSFFHLRLAILGVLEKYMDTMNVQVASSPRNEMDLPDELVARIRNHELEKQAGQIIQELLKTPSVFAVHEFEDEWSRFKTVTRSIIFIKTGLLEKDTP